MNRFHSVLSAAVVTSLSISAAFGQSVISAHSGLIHYVEGRVLLDSQPVEVKIAVFPEVKQNSELRTEDGRAEILLNPGAFLRVGENSAVRMVSNKLSDSRMGFVSGNAVVEAESSAEADGESIVTIMYKGTSVRIRKAGIYEFNSEPAQIRVFSGEAEVVSDNGNSVIAKGSRMVALNSVLTAEKFDSKDGNALTRWSSRRAQYISLANVSAAKSVSDSGENWKRGGWYYNSYYGMMAFLPIAGTVRSPYGYEIYSPGSVWALYQAPVYTPSYGGGMPSAGMSAPTQNAGPTYSPSTPTTASGTYSGSVSASPAPRAAPAGASAGPAPARR